MVALGHCAIIYMEQSYPEAVTDCAPAISITAPRGTRPMTFFSSVFFQKPVSLQQSSAGGASRRGSNVSPFSKLGGS